MERRKTALILSLIVLLPTLFYTAYEINSLNVNERMIDEIYQQQMNTVLYSVNQFAWDLINKWTDRLNLIVNEPVQADSALHNFLFENKAITTVIVSDTALETMHLTSLRQNMSINPDTLLQIFKPQKSVIQRLVYRKQVGYTQIESFPLNSANTSMVILYFIIIKNQKQPLLMTIILDINNFINIYLRPKLIEVTHNEFYLGVFKKGRSLPIISTGEISDRKVKLRKKIWILSDYTFGIKLKGTSVEDMARDRFHRSLFLITILDLMLIITALFLYRNIQKDMELARMKSDFVSRVSHELRTPLSLIRMYAETIEMGRTSSSEETIEYCKIISTESERLTHLINNILDFAKMAVGKKMYDFGILNLNGVVIDLLNIYNFHLKNKGFTLTKELSVGPLLINADQNAISEVLVNLIDNAMKYSIKEKTISVRTGIRNDMVFVEVADRGIGIPHHAQKKIFDKFYRVPGNPVQTVKGTGLGLTLVQNIIDSHKGKIEIESKPDQGSLFRILFPKHFET